MARARAATTRSTGGRKSKNQRCWNCHLFASARARFCPHCSADLDEEDPEPAAVVEEPAVLRTVQRPPRKRRPEVAPDPDEDDYDDDYDDDDDWDDDDDDDYEDEDEDDDY